MEFKAFHNRHPVHIPAIASVSQDTLPHLRLANTYSPDECSSKFKTATLENISDPEGKQGKFSQVIPSTRLATPFPVLLGDIRTEANGPGVSYSDRKQLSARHIPHWGQALSMVETRTI